MKAAVYRKAHFNAAHRLHVKEWSDEKNKRVFGPCNNPFYHGHNYVMELRVIGEVDPVTGIVVDMKFLSDLIEEKIESKFDHKNLNEQLPEFENLNPTAENICILIYSILRKAIDQKYDIMVRLYETPRNFVEYPVS